MTDEFTEKLTLKIHYKIHFFKFTFQNSLLRTHFSIFPLLKFPFWKFSFWNSLFELHFLKLTFKKPLFKNHFLKFTFWNWLLEIHFLQITFWNWLFEIHFLKFTYQIHFLKLTFWNSLFKIHLSNSLLKLTSQESLFKKLPTFRKALLQTNCFLKVNFLKFTFSSSYLMIWLVWQTDRHTCKHTGSALCVARSDFSEFARI